MASDAGIEALVARVQRLEDERAIGDTLRRYCHAIDHGDEAAWVDLFVADARIETHDTQDATSERPLVGHEWLARLASRHTRAPDRWHQHVVANSMIEVDPDGATARVESYFFLLMEEAGEREVMCFGRYRDRMVRCPDSKWRFEERIINVDSTNGRSVMRPKPAPSR
jgi:3-phenylpropionate/cinnamic acid dioxygenase small subunit